MRYLNIQHMICILVFTSTFICIDGSTPVLAQWVNDPMVNTLIADGAGEQIQPKIRPTHDGGCYISWYDGGAGYDVRLQRLNESGEEQWPHNGILVADLAWSWVQDYGLDVDESGNAILAFLDDRGTIDKVTANLVAPDGTLLWGIDGVELATATGGKFLGAPEPVTTGEGHYVIGWIEENETVLQKLASDGTPLWGLGVRLSVTGTDNFHLSDLEPSDSGSVIVSCIKEQFMVYRHLFAQKIATDGTLMWGASHVAVYDGGSLQMGNYPDFVTDGSGGAVFCWYEVTAGLQCFAQHIQYDGTEVFPHNGVVASTNPSQCRVNPAVSFDEMTSETYMFWIEENLGQTKWGIYGQRYASDGTRLWTDNGLEITPVDDLQNIRVKTFFFDDGVAVYFDEEVSAGNDHLFGARLDSTGSLLWPSGIIDISICPSEKSRHDATLTPNNVSLLAWTDTRTDAGDIYGQSVNPDGTLGPPPPPVPAFSLIDTFILVFVLSFIQQFLLQSHLLYKR